MRSQNCSSPAHHRFQVLRPLTSSSVRSMPPSIGWKTFLESSGKSSGLRPPALSTSESLLVTQPNARHAITKAVARLEFNNFLNFSFIMGQVKEKTVLGLI